MVSLNAFMLDCLEIVSLLPLSADVSNVNNLFCLSSQTKQKHHHQVDKKKQRVSDYLFQMDINN